MNTPLLLSTRFLLLVALCIWLFLPVALAQTTPEQPGKQEASSEPLLPNSSCPVTVHMPALPEHSLTYKGRKVYFCCQECEKEFRENPGDYVANLPPLPKVQDNPEGSENSSDWDDGEGSERTESFPRHYWVLALTVIGALIVFRRLRNKNGKREKKKKEATNSAHGAKLLCAVLVGLFIPVLYTLYNLKSYASEKAKIDVIHHAVFHDFGIPPVPAKPRIEKRIKATFYRGNDERDPRLFNGGHYLTSMFHVSLRAGGAEDLDYGDGAGGRDLFLRVEIERAPHTPDFFFKDRIMGKIFLSRQFDYFLGRDGPVSDEVRLTVLEDLHRWEALYPLGAAPLQGAGRLEGIVYICQEFYLYLGDLSAGERFFVSGVWPFGSADRERVGSRYHFAMQYDLHFQDGAVAADSDVWMGSLYRTTKVTLARLPLSEWFSHEPIPPLPERQADDPELLGLEDNQDELSGFGQDQ